MILETERLYLRQMNQGDFQSLCSILQDEETMYAYEGPFCDREVQEWLDRQLARYQKWGFGLWAVILKETGEMIGQCGLSMQPWKDRESLSVTAYNPTPRSGLRGVEPSRLYKPADIPLLAVAWL